MGVLCACSFTIGLALYLSGAWPAVGFLGLDVLVVYVAFRLNYRAARAYETVRLTRAELEVTQVDPRGRGRRVTFQPYWPAVDKIGRASCRARECQHVEISVVPV